VAAGLIGDALSRLVSLPQFQARRRTLLCRSGFSRDRAFPVKRRG